jgi:hypothetical protein
VISTPTPKPGRRSVDEVQLASAADGRRKAVDVELSVDRPERVWIVLNDTNRRDAAWRFRARGEHLGPRSPTGKRVRWNHHRVAAWRRAVR